MNQSAATHKPPEQPSSEGDKAGLGLAKEQGDAFLETLHHMVEDIAEKGNKKTAGEYLVGYAIEKAEGLYLMHDGSLEWEEPGDNNIHIEVVVCDGADHRFIPYLEVTVTVSDSDGKVIGTNVLPFLWHPYLFHYGRNWKVPGDGEYNLRVQIEPPEFSRHDKVNGKRYTEPVEVDFTGVKFKTGHG